MVVQHQRCHDETAVIGCEGAMVCMMQAHSREGCECRAAGMTAQVIDERELGTRLGWAMECVQM